MNLTSKLTASFALALASFGMAQAQQLNMPIIQIGRAHV